MAGCVTLSIRKRCERRHVHSVYAGIRLRSVLQYGLDEHDLLRTISNSSTTGTELVPDLVRYVLTTQDRPICSPAVNIPVAGGSAVRSIYAKLGPHRVPFCYV